jgi:hypothetical protein
MIVNGDRENFFSPVLANDPFIQLLINFFRGEDAIGLELRRRRGRIFLQNISAQVNALIADKNLIRPGNEAIDLFLRPLTK